MATKRGYDITDAAAASALLMFLSVSWLIKPVIALILIDLYIRIRKVSIVCFFNKEIDSKMDRLLC
jgi:hypothetical protein